MFQRCLFKYCCFAFGFLNLIALLGLVEAHAQLSCRSEAAQIIDVPKCASPLGQGVCASPFYEDILFTTPFSVPPHVLVAPAAMTDSSTGATPCANSTTDKIICYPRDITVNGFRLVCSGSPGEGTCDGKAGYFSRAKASWMAFDGRPGCQGVSGHLQEAPNCTGSLVGGLCNNGFTGNIAFPSQSSLVAAPKLVTAPENMSSQAGCVAGTMDTFLTYAGNQTQSGFLLTSYASPAGDGCGSYRGWVSRADSGYFGAVDRKNCGVDSQQLLVTDRCTSGLSTNGTCGVRWKRDVRFSKTFSTPPRVVITPQQASHSTPCTAGGGTDIVTCFITPGSLTTTGMTVECSGSPVGTSCGASGTFTKAQFSYVALDTACRVAECQDGLDNDGDGRFDLNDPSCRNNPNLDDESNNTGLPSRVTQLAASDGTFSDKVLLTWNYSTNATQYELHRSAESGSVGPVFAIVPQGTLSYNDTAAQPGVTYYYSVYAQNSLTSGERSNVDTGYRVAPPPAKCRDNQDNDGDGLIDLNDPGCRNDPNGEDEGSEGFRPGGISTVQASDGTNVDAVIVTWSTSQYATSYDIFRADYPGDTGAMVGRTAGELTYSDVSAVPGVVYYYRVYGVNHLGYGPASAQTDSGYRGVASIPQCRDQRDNDGDGFTDLNDPGCAGNSNGNNESAEGDRPGRVVDLSASDGSSTEFVRLAWSAATNASSYQVYRSQYEGALGDPLGSATSALTIDDRSAVPGVLYYYSVVSRNSVGDGPRSNVDGGFRGTTSNGDQDSDGDGSTDEQEQADGTDPLDPGSFQLHLRSPAFTKYNSYLNQLNFLELIANGSVAIQAQVTAYDLQGAVLGVMPVALQPGQQFDVDVLTLIGNRRDTYGVVKIEFDDRTPGSSLIGRMTHYRRNPRASDYSFAFARELRNATRGVTFAPGNSYDPQGSGFLVPNWAEIVNVSDAPQTFVARLYNQQGSQLYARTLTVPSLGELDIQAGHEYGQNVYLLSVTPMNGEARYLMAVSRYSSNSRGGNEAETYNFAFSIEGRNGSGDALYAPVQNRVGGCYTQTNWFEVINTRETSVSANVVFRSNDGAVLGQTDLNLAPKSQYHMNASALLPARSDGFVRVESNEPGSILAQSLVYFHDCAANRLQTGFSFQARVAGQDVQAGSLNSFLNMENELYVVNAVQRGLNVRSTISGAGLASPIERTLNLGAQGQVVQMATGASTGFPSNAYGVLRLDTNRQARAIAPFVTRSRTLSNGKMDFVFQTAVQ